MRAQDVFGRTLCLLVRRLLAGEGCSQTPQPAEKNADVAAIDSISQVPERPTVVATFSILADWESSLAVCPVCADHLCQLHDRFISGMAPADFPGRRHGAGPYPVVCAGCHRSPASVFLRLLRT